MIGISTDELSAMVSKIEDPLKRAEQGMKYFDNLGESDKATEYARQYISGSIEYLKTHPDKLPAFRNSSYGRDEDDKNKDVLQKLEETAKKYNFNSDFGRDIALLTLLAELSTDYTTYRGNPSEQLQKISLSEEEKSEFYLDVFRNAQKRKTRQVQSLLLNSKIIELSANYPEIREAAKEQLFQYLNTYRETPSTHVSFEGMAKLVESYGLNSADAKKQVRTAIARLLSEGQFDFAPKLAESFGIKITSRERNRAAKSIEKKYEDSVRSGDLSAAFKERERAERFARFRRTKDNFVSQIKDVVLPDKYSGKFMLLLVGDKKKPVIRVQKTRDSGMHRNIVDEFRNELFDLGMNISYRENGGGHISIDPKNKVVSVGGRSEDYGEADFATAESLLRPYVEANFPEYTLRVERETPRRGW